MKKKVSIIIPVYNAEKFIEKGIKSVLNQTYKNVELLLINDGSKDNSLSIIKKWEKKYPNIIKVYSHKNMGVGKTRNKGLDCATGEYICFIDADDYIDCDFIETLVNQIGKNDIIVSGYRQVDENGNLNFTQCLKEDEWSKFRQVTIWSKLYKKEFLDKYNIRFNDLKIGEDIVFSISTYVKSKKIISINYVGYNNVENFSSVTHNSKLKKDNDILSTFVILGDITKEEEFLKYNKKNIELFYLKTFTFFLFDKAIVLNFEELKDYYCLGLKWMEDYFKKYKISFGMLWNKSEPFKVNIAMNLVLLSYKLHFSDVFLNLVHKFFYKD